jgi:hypothetical protein
VNESSFRKLKVRRESAELSDAGKAWISERKAAKEVAEAARPSDELRCLRQIRNMMGFFTVLVVIHLTVTILFSGVMR